MNKMRNILISMFVILVICLIPNFVNAAEETTHVTEMQIKSPKTGTYEQGKVITMHVYFNNKITGTIPTLQIKFGSGSKINVTNGTIHNDDKVSTYGQYIEYSYVIQDKDSGKLSLVGISGGAIKDVDGKDVALTSVKQTGGNTITAKTVVNKENTSTEKEETEKKETTQKENSKKTTSQKDKTTAKTKIPYTGINFAVLIIISLIIIIGIIAKIKHNGLKDI